MHILQYVAVKLEDKVDKDNLDEALSNAADEVESTLQGDEQQYADWYDWFIVGGGRFLEGDDYTKNHKNCIAFATEPEKFNEILERQLGWRMDEAKRLHEEVKDIDFNDVVEDFLSTRGYTRHETKFDNRVWSLGKLANLINDHWLSQSYFYDLTTGTPSPTYVTRDIGEGNGGHWVLVPVDFHH
jgi:plasmid replication initiation protein